MSKTEEIKYYVVASLSAIGAMSLFMFLGARFGVGRGTLLFLGGVISSWSYFNVLNALRK